MEKKDLQTILKYVHSGITLQIKIVGCDGTQILLPIDGVEAYSDQTILLCHDSSIHIGEQKDED